MALGARLLQPVQGPIMVRVLDRDDQTAFDFADVLVKALGLTGALMVGSLILGVVAGGVFIGLRMLRARAATDADPLSITPPTTFEP